VFKSLFKGLAGCPLVPKKVQRKIRRAGTVAKSHMDSKKVFKIFRKLKKHLKKI